MLKCLGLVLIPNMQVRPLRARSSAIVALNVGLHAMLCCAVLCVSEKYTVVACARRAIGDTIG